MTIIADATALVLLAKISVLEIFVGRSNVITSKEAYEEVMRGREKGRTDSILTEKLVKEGKLKVMAPSKPVRDNIEKLFNLKGGELEVISLAYKKRHIILSDDKKCLNAAKALGINFITSLDVIAALQKKNVISKSKALECINGLEEYGWYAKDLINKYREAVK